MAKNRVMTEDHHRRARSIGGTDHPANKSFVKNKDHKYWHTLFGNMNVFQICDHINQMEYKPENIIIICKFINGTEVIKLGENNSKKKNKISRAWEFLFKELEFTEIIEYINNVWLDPSYHFYIKKIKIQK